MTANLSKTNSTCSSRSDKRLNLNLTLLSQNSSTNNFYTRKPANPILTANILNFHENPLQPAGATTANAASKANIENLLKAHLLISLNEMKNSKLIVHSKKIDNNLLFLFTNKQTHSRYNLEFFDSNPIKTKTKTTNTITAEQNNNNNNTKSFKNCSFKDFNETIEVFNLSHNINSNRNESVTSMNNVKEVATISKASIDLRDLQDYAAKTNFSWRENLGEIYENLSDTACDSYRKSYRITYDQAKEERPPLLASISKMGGAGASRANVNSNASVNRRTSTLSKATSSSSQPNQKSRQS